MILEILNKLSATSSRLEKQAILNAHKNNELLKRVFRMTYHPRLQYWIKKIPPMVDLEQEYTLEEALDVLEFNLAPRKTTGNAAIKLLADVGSRLSPDDQKVLMRVVKRDLEVGCSENTTNETWEDLIPIQPQMLASSCSEKTLKNIKYPAIVQLKADGARCFAEIRGDKLEDVTLLSRGGNEYLDLDVIKQELIDITKDMRKEFPFDQGVMIDGEIVSHIIKCDSKEDVAASAETAGLDFILGAGVEEHEEVVENAVARSKSNGLANKSLKGTITPEEAETMKFQVWDLVPLRSIYGKETIDSSVYHCRFSELERITFGSTKVELIESFEVNSLDEAREIYKEYVLRGLEGIILKNRDGIWENKRSKNQVKFKEEITFDLVITGFIQHKKNPDKLGALECESHDGIVKVSVGSGFTDTEKEKIGKNGGYKFVPVEDRGELDRSLLWLTRESLIGKIVEVKCNGWITKEGRNDSISLFLPIILKIRHDKTEANTLSDVFPDCPFVRVNNESM